MNIAIFSPSKSAYSETFIQAHKEYLKDNIFYYYGTLRNIKLEGGKISLSYIKRLYFKFLKKLLKKPSTFIHNKKLLASIKNSNIDVLLIEYGTHAHHLLPFIKQLKIPVIVHFHGYDASVKEVVRNCNYYKEVFETASKIIVVSYKMKEMILELGCPKSKIVYNVYGPQPKFEAVYPLFTKKQFIAIGRFTDKKAPYYIILAFKKVLTKHPDATLLMAGNGSLFNMCKNLITYLNLSNQVELLGVISPEKYCELLTESLAFVQHSITAESGDMEGTPLGVLEASAAGVPVVSTLHAGIPDVVMHDKTGLLSEEHDVEAMSINMIKLLNDKEYAIKMGKAAKKHIKENYNLDKHIFVLQSTLERAIKNK